jgi:hypothetical protein
MLNWWGTFGAQNPFMFGTEHVNAVDKNHYTSALPGHLSIGSEYTKLSCMIPSPTQILCELMKNKKYCIYMTFEGRVPRNDDEQFNYIHPMDQVFYATVEKPHKCKSSQDIGKSVCTHNEEWLFDTGATVHVTMDKHLLCNTSICCRENKVAKGRHVRARQVGGVLLRSECDNYLYLQGVLYSPAFNKNIISAPQLMQTQDYIIIMKKQLQGDAVQGYWSKDEIKDYKEFMYMFWPATTGTCIKIPDTKN